MPTAAVTAIPSPLSFLCLASYEKGHQTLVELKRQGCQVFLLTSLSLKDKANWPLDKLDDIFYMQDQQHIWNLPDMLKGVSYLAKTISIDRIIALERLRCGEGGHVARASAAAGTGRNDGALLW